MRPRWVLGLPVVEVPIEPEPMPSRTPYLDGDFGGELPKLKDAPRSLFGLPKSGRESPKSPLFMAGGGPPGVDEGMNDRSGGGPAGVVDGAFWLCLWGGVLERPPRNIAAVELDGAGSANTINHRYGSSQV